MQWLALRNRAGEPAMKVGEEVLFACHATHNPALRCMLLGRLKEDRGSRAVARPVGPDFVIQSTWDGKILDEVIVPYAFARPELPEPKA